MSCSVTHYWEEHTDNISSKLSVAIGSKHLGVASDADIIQISPTIGMIDARAWFDDGAYVDIIETVEIRPVPHRLQYRYELIVDGEEVQRRERDPNFGETEELYHHLNRPLESGGYSHEPTTPISLKAFLSSCWDLIASVRELRRQEGDDRGF